MIGIKSVNAEVHVYILLYTLYQKEKKKRKGEQSIYRRLKPIHTYIDNKIICLQINPTTILH